MNPTLVTESNRYVSLGCVEVSASPNETLIVHGLGSCVALLAYDPVKNVGGIAHIMLPKCPSVTTVDNNKPAQYVQTAIPALIESLKEAGGSENLSDYVFKIAGGAQMIQSQDLPVYGLDGTTANRQMVNIGLRNIIALRASLQESGVFPEKMHTGGIFGRSLRLEIGSGKTWLKIIGHSEDLW